MQDAPAYAADGQAPWVIASGVIYPEDITDDSPYLFSELPGRFTGSYSGYNQDPLYVSVRPSCHFPRQTPVCSTCLTTMVRVFLLWVCQGCAVPGRSQHRSHWLRLIARKAYSAVMYIRLGKFSPAASTLRALIACRRPEMFVAVPMVRAHSVMCL